MIAKYIKPTFHFFSTAPNNKPIGTASARAVKAESCRGEIFLMENISQRYKVQGTRYKDVLWLNSIYDIGRYKDQTARYKIQESSCGEPPMYTINSFRALLCFVPCTLCLSV